MQFRNIVLVGFMGSGKSAVGQVLSKKLGFGFLDTDLLIEQNQKCSIKEIFKNFGEAYFRNLETQTLGEIENYQKQVIATGGGIILKEENVLKLKKLGVVVWLWVSPEKAVERLGGNHDRPLMATNRPLLTATQIIQKRKELYLSAADIKIDTDQLKIEQVSDKIIEAIHDKN